MRIQKVCFLTKSRESTVEWRIDMSQKKNTGQKKYYYDKEPDKKTVWLQLLPLLFVVGIVPLVSKQAVYIAKLSQYAWFTEDDGAVDFFLYYKTQLFLVAAAVMLVFVVAKWIKQGKKIFSVKLFAPLFVYILLVFLSSACSEYQDYVWSYSYEQFESALVLMGYALLTYYAYLYVDSEYGVKLFMWILAAMALIMSVLAVFQMSGHDFFATKLGQYLLLTKEYRESGNEIQYTMGNMAYGTLYNPNYLGVFSVTLLPVFVTFLFVQAGKCKEVLKNEEAQGKKKIFAILCVVGTFILVILLGGALLASQSKAGLLVLVLVGCVTILLRLRGVVKYWYLVIPAITAVMLSFSLVDTAKDNLYTNRLKAALQIQENNPELQSIVTAGDGVTMRYKDREIVFTLTDGEYAVPLALENGKLLELIQGEDGKFVFTDITLNGISVENAYYDNILSFAVTVGGRTWGFVKDFAVMGYQYVNEFGRAVDCVEAESFLFDGYESFASARGYIWSRTLPLLKDAIFLGNGANTYAVTLPQNDYVARNQNGFYTQIITKPHNGYLQTAQQSGVLSLVCILVFYGMYLVQSIKLYWKNTLQSMLGKIGFGLFLSVFAYLVMAITNDSMIVIAPIFWALLGVGLAVNRMVKEQDV